MEKEQRSVIQRATQKARQILEHEFAEQLEGLYDIHLDGTIAPAPGEHLNDRERVVRDKLIAAIQHLESGGAAAAVRTFLREAAFTCLNRFVALRMLEERELILGSIGKGLESPGFREFGGLAPGLATLPDKGYRLYLESLFDEAGTEVGILFDRRDSSSLLWPRHTALDQLLATLNAPELTPAWREDETIGWVYQYFNSDKDREAARYDAKGKPKPPQNSYDLAVRNQFFTPSYVVKFLSENTLVRTWYEMRAGDTALKESCEYFVAPDAIEGGELQPRDKKDPRDFKILDPACGSGHFLLYCYELLRTIYQEAWADPDAPKSELTGHNLREDYPDEATLIQAVPGLILANNLFGIDIDSRASQIAALALWMRAQRGYQEAGVGRDQRPTISRTGIAAAEPMPGDKSIVDAFASSVEDDALVRLMSNVIDEMKLAGDLGSLLPIERIVEQAVHKELGGSGDMFADVDQERWAQAESWLLKALEDYAHATSDESRRLFAEDAAHGFAFIDLLRQRYDVVLMNPPFGEGSRKAKKAFEKFYRRTKNDVYAAFVERGLQLLHPRGMLGAITSRTGFFLSSFQKWREEILLKEANMTVFADLGAGVLDSAMVETAAYCMEAA